MVRRVFGSEDVFIFFIFLILIFKKPPSGRRPWFPKFRAALKAGDTIDSIEFLLRYKVEKWRGRPPRNMNTEVDESLDEEIMISNLCF